MASEKLNLHVLSSTRIAKISQRFVIVLPLGREQSGAVYCLDRTDKLGIIKIITMAINNNVVVCFKMKKLDCIVRANTSSWLNENPPTQYVKP